MSDLTSGAFWKAAAIRALRTAIFIAIPYVPTLIATESYLLVLSAAGFGFVTSIVTSLFGIAETTGATRPWYFAILERVVKTAAQALLTAFGTATLFAEVDWNAVVPLVATAVLGSLLAGFVKTLPETKDPIAEATVAITVTNPETGEETEEAAPVQVAVPASEEAVG